MRLSSRRAAPRRECASGSSGRCRRTSSQLGLRRGDLARGEEGGAEAQPRRHVARRAPEDLPVGLGGERGLLQVGEGLRREPHQRRVERGEAPPVGLPEKTQRLLLLAGLGGEKPLDEDGLGGPTLALRLLLRRGRARRAPEALLQLRSEAIPLLLRLRDAATPEEDVDRVEGEALVGVERGLQAPQEGPGRLGVAPGERGIEGGEIRVVPPGRELGRPGGRDQKEEPRDDRSTAAPPRSHRSGSVTCRTWLTAGFSIRCTIPLGQAISIETTAVSFPRPKCTRLSLAE